MKTNTIFLKMQKAIMLSVTMAFLTAPLVATAIPIPSTPTNMAFWL